MIEIKELVVRAVVVNNLPAQSGSSESSESNNTEAASSAGTDNTVVEACVRQVLAILERQKER